jgi:hypothetical protein
MTTKRIVMLSVFGALLLIMCIYGACGPMPLQTVEVDQGREAVLTLKPYFFGQGGVYPESVKPGRMWVAASTTWDMCYTKPFTFDEEFTDIMPRDNNPVDYHAAVRLRTLDCVKLITKYGGDWVQGKDPAYPLWYTSNIQRPFQTMNRDEVRARSMPELALQQTVVAEVERSLKAKLEAHVAAIGIPIEVQEVTLGRISPAKEIIAAYNDTGVQQQQAKTQVQRALAEVARRDAEIKRAEADRAYQNSMGISADQYIKLQEIKMCGESDKCTVVLGAMPQVMVTR